MSGLDDLIKSLEGEETAVKKAQRIRAEQFIAKSEEPPKPAKKVEIDPITGLPLKEAAAQETAKTTIVEKRQKRKALTTRKKTTLEEKGTDLGGRSKANTALVDAARERQNTKIDKQIEKEGLTDSEAVETRRKELRMQGDPGTALQESIGGTIADSTQYVLNIKNNPQVYGDNPDFYNVIGNVNAAESEIQNYYQEVNNSLQVAKNNLPPDKIGNQYYMSKVQEKIEQTLLEDVQHRTGYPLQAWAGYINGVKAGSSNFTPIVIDTTETPAQGAAPATQGYSSPMDRVLNEPPPVSEQPQLLDLGSEIMKRRF